MNKRIATSLTTKALIEGSKKQKLSDETIVQIADSCYTTVSSV